MIRFLYVFLLIVSASAGASDRLVIDKYTKHTSECQEAYSVSCEPWKQPRRVSWQHDLNDELSTDIGYGKNSYGANSTNLGVMWQPLSFGIIKAGVWSSIVTGYDCNQLRTCFMAGGVVTSIVIRGAVVQVLYVPPIGDGTIGVVSVRAGVEF